MITRMTVAVLASCSVLTSAAFAQDQLPADNGVFSYHTSPRYRESESHPLRIAAYVLHPVGWLAREAIFRPFSYLVGSNEVTKSVFGYREPFDFRTPECFTADDSTPDCRTVMPFNYDTNTGAMVAPVAGDMGGDTAAVMSDRQVYLPDVNFDFDRRSLNDLGQGRARQIAQMLKGQDGVHVVLQGHADYKGSDEYNQKLGMDRAEALRAELVALGVPADRLSTVTFGESEPIFADETDWARAVNRRVEVHVDERR